MAEDDVLRLILAPAQLNDANVASLTSPCGAVPPLLLGDLVCDRNRIVLDAFPTGTLSRQLAEQPIQLWYARRDADAMWTLVDERFLSRWRIAPGLNRSDTPLTAIIERLANALGISVADFAQLMQGRQRGPVELQYLAVSTYPPILMQADLHVASEQEEAFVRARFPLMAPGHLSFLYQFYRPEY